MNQVNENFARTAKTVAKHFIRDASNIVELYHESYKCYQDGIQNLFRQLNPNTQFYDSIEDINRDTQLVFINNLLTADDAGVALLREIYQKTAADVEVVLCIRNTNYWEDIEAAIHPEIPSSILNGMNYKALTQLISRSDYTLLPIVGQKDQSPEFAAFCQKIDSFMSNATTQQKKEQYALIAAPYFIVRLVKKESNFKQILLQSLTLKPKGAVNDIRIDFPFDALSTIPGIEKRISHSSIELAKKSDLRHKIMVWHRPLLEYSDAHKIKILMKNGYLITVDWDDWYERWPEITERNFINFRYFHAISTSKPELAEALKGFNPNIEVFPNSIYLLSDYREPLHRDKYSVFFGAIGREDEVQQLKEPIRQLIDQYGDQLHFEVINTKNLFDWLPTTQKNFTPLCNYGVYNDVLATCDFCLLPLSDNKFNSMKSDLKYIEAASKGVIAIASPVVYESTIRHKETGFIYRSNEDIVSSISYCIENKDKAISVSRNAYNYVRDNRMLSSHFRRRYDWYLGLLDRLPELNKELQARCPELQDN